MPPEIRKASFGLTFLKGVAVFLVFALVVWAFFGLTHRQDSYDAERGAERLKKLQDYKKTEEAKLAGVAWVDKEKGFVRLPIEQAMQSEVAALQAKPVAPSATKVDEPYPVGLANLKIDLEPADATASPSPAAPAKP